MANSNGPLRVAAIGDLHVQEDDVAPYRELFSEVSSHADVLLLCGDLTNFGKTTEAEILAEDIRSCSIPVLGVLGNHDYECGVPEEVARILREAGMTVLDEQAVEVNGVGFAGVKGFMGGFGRGTLTAFGEPETKAIVGAALDEVHKLELALRRLSTPLRVAVMHYAPVVGTVIGEPEIIFPFLGTDRMAEPLDRYGAAVAFHGHAHSGAFRGTTAGGVPVFNVSLPVLRREGIGKMYYVHEATVPAAQQPAHPAQGAQQAPSASA